MGQNMKKAAIAILVITVMMMMSSMAMASRETINYVKKDESEISINEDPQCYPKCFKKCLNIQRNPGMCSFFCHAECGF
ncbi:uncharacterized protein G2W53_003079 [Senna tora]|uniref:Uncharacterized protein n=1 Tax=Senna tora TaxID=362788 RepID=A0A835CGI9_9FABA|nr:uncharacterized protein G2W53_003079 [Senna tora]